MARSKAEVQKEADEVKAILDAAKKKQHNVAMLIGKDGIVIEADFRLPADKLMLRAKKRDGATPRGFCGKLDVSGITLKITPDEEVPGGFDVKLKKYLADLGLKFKPEIAEAGGGSGAGAGGAAKPAAAAEAKKAERKKKLEDLEKSIAGVTSRLHQMMERLSG